MSTDNNETGKVVVTTTDVKESEEQKDLRQIMDQV
jgi:hypothetical protein